MAVRTTRPGDKVVILRGSHGGALRLDHALDVSAEEGAELTGPVTLSGDGGVGWGGSGGGGGG
eukprot:2769503-Pleurochrysis_carterae.AAC.3